MAIAMRWPASGFGRQGAQQRPPKCRVANNSASPSPAPSSPNPDTLLADEPTGNLDSVTTREIMDLLCAAERPIAASRCMMVTHDDRSGIVRHGRIGP
jgi:predicted ABC-type transport system involved in lysophospholipase L1 biosynthesis ATPase subunit